MPEIIHAKPPVYGPFLFTYGPMTEAQAVAKFPQAKRLFVWREGGVDKVAVYFVGEVKSGN